MNRRLAFITYLLLLSYFIFFVTCKKNIVMKVVVHLPLLPVPLAMEVLHLLDHQTNVKILLQEEIILPTHV
jgi:uncharacterized protein YqhQ